MTAITKRKTNAQLFSDALTEAFERKYNDALLESADVSLTEDTCLAVSRRFAEHLRRRRLKTALIAAVIAAATLLCGCTAYVYREQIADFLLEHTFLRTYVSQEAAATSISDLPEPNYRLSYVPAGYELTEEKTQAVGSDSIWTNSESEKIIFYQDLKNLKATVDNENTAKYTITTEDRTILYFEIEKSFYVYMWNDDCFTFKLKTSEKFTDEEILRMIESMTAAE